MNITESKRKLKALKLLATLSSHKKIAAYEQLSEQNRFALHLQGEREHIEKNLVTASASLEVGAVESGVFCPELYGAKLGYIDELYKSKEGCDASITKNNTIINQVKNSLLELTSRTNLIDDKYMEEKLKYIAQVIKQQEAQ